MGVGVGLGTCVSVGLGSGVFVGAGIVIGGIGVLVAVAAISDGLQAMSVRISRIKMKVRRILDTFLQHMGFSSIIAETQIPIAWEETIC